MSWQIAKGRKGDFFKYHYHHDVKSSVRRLFRDDKTVGFGAKDIRFDQENIENASLKSWKKLIDQSLSTGIDEKGSLH